MSLRASDYDYDITAWLPSQDGDFCNTFLMKCLTRFEFQRFQHYQHTLEQQQQQQQDDDNDDDDDNRGGTRESRNEEDDDENDNEGDDEDTRRIDIQVESILSCLEAIDRAENSMTKKENGAREEDEIRQVLIKIILGWVDGCKGVILKGGHDINSTNHIGIDFISPMKNNVDNCPLLSVSYASNGTYEQARRFLSEDSHGGNGNIKDENRSYEQTDDDDHFPDNVSIIECTHEAQMGVEKLCFHQTVRGSMIDFTSGSELDVREGILAMPFDIRQWDGDGGGDDSDDSEDGDDETDQECQDQHDLDESSTRTCINTMNGGHEDYPQGYNHDNESVSIRSARSAQSFISARSTRTARSVRSSNSARSMRSARSPSKKQNDHVRVTPLPVVEKKHYRRGIFSRVLGFIILSLSYFGYRYISFLSQNDPYFSVTQNLFTVDTIAELSVNQTIVITGASAGLGKSSVKLLAKAGTADLVIMACRNLKKCEMAKDEIMLDIFRRTGEYNKPQLVPIQLDLSSIPSIQDFATNVQDVLVEYQSFQDDGKSPKLDVLINNAGIMCATETIEHNAETNVETQMHVNHLGHFALTKLLILNLMGGGRIVSVSSLAASFPFALYDMIRRDDPYVLSSKNDKRSNDDGQISFSLGRLIKRVSHFLQESKPYRIITNIAAYGASKRANLLFTDGFNQRFSGESFGITAVASHPGYSRTELMMSGWAFASSNMKNFLKNNPIAAMPSDIGALTQLRAAFDKVNVRRNMYVGPLFATTGIPVIVGSSLQSFHHYLWPIGDETRDTIIDNFWSFSEDALGKDWKFGNESISSLSSSLR
uniref:Protochlorophyllide reductase n=1 Tax=Chaetoceros debilis TaxID=122233 RepID=A0A7S3Q6K6_9STRA